jgi:dihydropteroate synthase
MTGKNTDFHQNIAASEIGNMQKFTLSSGGRPIDLHTPKVMAIINLTPDSFYQSSGRKNEIPTSKQVLKEAEKHLLEGAYFLDLGGYSSRPGAEHVSEKEEADRVLPAIKALAKEFPEAFISVDTFRSEIAQKSVDEGAHLINDISAGQLDECMFETMAQLQVPYILMHLKGTPQTMQSLANYTDLVPEVLSYFTEKLTQLKQLGANQLIIDPGFGFAKTLEHNYELLNRFQELHSLGFPLLAGVSRKSIIYKTLDSTPADALNGTTVLHTIALQKGAHILRVHDVKPAIEAIKLVAKLQAN